MSADAKIWLDDGLWQGIHDGSCNANEMHTQGSHSLFFILQELDYCSPHVWRWEFGAFPDGELGLVGYAM